ncbi:MAG: hypothetical protein HYY05_04185 [Chloroflexi bacterium]|nr:hypothetical protein [Chloroflexota bacterium]
MPSWLLRLVAEGEADPLEMAVFRSYVYGDLESPPPWLLRRVAAIPRNAVLKERALAGSPDR